MVQSILFSFRKHRLDNSCQYFRKDNYNLELIKQIDSRDGNIGGDPEGIAVYKTGAKDGFIILSSQGDNKFNMYDAAIGFGCGLGTSSIISSLTKTKQKKGSGGFRLGGLPGTAHNVGRRTNPQ